MVRIKHRYLLINILYPSPSEAKPSRPSSSARPEEPLPWTIQFRRPTSDKFSSAILHRMIKEGVAELFGDYGAGMIAGSLQIKYCSAATSTAIIRVARAHYRMVWAALTFVTSLPKQGGGEECVVQVVRVSGTIKKSEEEAVRRARGVIKRIRREQERGRGVGGVLQDEEDGMEDLNMMNGIEDGDEGGEDEED